ncbi:MAG: type II toxin-antitoxin system VapC family toxin [Methanothrix sp.]|nr:type II toxin-antitoxin system VapC family toxin [Methanothrix sp.]
MKRYLLDTNILIYYWKGDIPKGEMEHVEEILKHSFIISIITKIELLGWKKHTRDGYEIARDFLDRAEILPIDDDLAEYTIELKRNNNIKLADALIAATALSNELVLVTRNEDDFSILANLEIYNPFDADS